MVICIQKHPNELYMVTTPPFINPMNVYVLTAIMTKKAVLTVKPICALTEQISAVFALTEQISAVFDNPVLFSPHM